MTFILWTENNENHILATFRSDEQHNVTKGITKDKFKRPIII